MKTSFLMLLLWGIFTKSYLFGQARFYIQIPDQKDVPKISQINATNEYIVESGEYTTDRVFAKYRIMKFQKAFPHSKTKYLQEIYEINCNDIALMNELRNSLSDKYPYLQEIPSDELCILPNDYDYSGGFPGDQSFLTHIRAEEAWDITHGDPNIPIGITDTHFETTHEDLQNKIIQVYGSNYLPDNYDDNEDLLHFWEHGTVTSGTMAAETNNGLGLSSIGYNCSIVASSNWANYDELIMLSQQGVRVINASWGHYDVYIPAQQAAIDEIYDNGTLIVAAAGNDTVTNYFYPASYNHVFSVAIIGHRNEPGYQDPILGPFNWKDRVELYVGDPSHVSTHNDSVDLCAPGWQITSCRLNNSYADLYANGTSVSAPLVTGTCGLMLSINPCLTNDDLTNILKQTVVNIYNIPENQNYIGMYGAGRLDSYEAVKQAGEKGTAHYSNITLNNSNIARSGISLDNNVTMTGSNNLVARYKVTITKNFQLPLGSILNINVNTANNINCQ